MAAAHLHRIRIRYAETDQMGVVYHANFLVYMDEARTRLMEDLGFPYHRFEKSGRALVVRKADVRYRAPLFFGDELEVRTSATRVRGASVLFTYEMTVVADGRRVAEGTTELACVDLRSPERPPTMLPDEIREALAAQAPIGGS